MAIENLKNNGEDILDMTAPPKQATVSMSNIGHNNQPAELANEDGEIDMTKPPRATQAQHPTKLKVSTSGGSRQAVSITDLKGEEKVVHGDPTKSDMQKVSEVMLDPDNPDSDFNQFLNRKRSEYNQRMAIEEERVREAVEEGKLDRNSEIAKSWLGEEANDMKKVRAADLDLDDIMSEKNKTEEFQIPAVNIEPVKQEAAPAMKVGNAVEEEEEDPMKELLEESENDTVESDDDEEDIKDDDLDALTSDDTEEEELEEVVPPKKEEKKETPKSVKVTDIALNFSSRKSDLKDDDEEEDEEDSSDDNDLVERLRKMATEKLRPKNSHIDISGYGIAKATVTNINPIISMKENRVAKWVLMNQEQAIFMREFSGVDLQQLAEASGSNSASNMTRRLRILYNHIESDKPGSFEAWLKSTPYSDMDHYFGGAYVASFEGANYIPVDCEGGTKCPEGTFVSDDIPIMNMVKFRDDKIAAKFKKIYRDENVSGNTEGKYVYSAAAINNTIAISFKEPMLYDLIESLNVDETFRRKYNSVLNLAPYINEFYYIDQQSGNLVPIRYNEYPGNASKTFRSKIRKYNTLISYLTPDEYAMIEAYAADIRDREDGVTYIIPSLTCPYCGTESKELEMTAENLVFTRYQLGALVNTTLK